jgi:hypothetical protein
MKISTAVLVASITASGAVADFLPTGTLTASGIAGTGVYQLSGNSWTITFSFDGDVDASSMNSDFGNWTLTLLGTNGKTWLASSGDVVDGAWTRTGSAERMLTIKLAEGTGLGDGDVSPEPTYISIGYAARKSGSSWESLGNALLYSGNPETPSNSRGSLVVRSGESNVISGTFSTAIPTPGAAAVVGLGALMSRRRKA